MFDTVHARELYDVTKRWFVFAALGAAPASLLINAPFGRFSPADQNSIFLVDGIKAWVVMELVAPLAFMNSYMRSPLAVKNLGRSPDMSLKNPTTFLAGLYMIHYLNRALISPLRTSSRSKSHITVPLFAITFNLVAGSLMGCYLSSPEGFSFLAGAFSRPRFWFGVAMWALGFAGNVLHDEVLLNIRLQAKSKGKAKATDDTDTKNGKNQREHYAIPYGYLYSFISYPNYFCEWVEWFGFALAAAPVPVFWSIDSYCPPWAFALAEVLVMVPRAYRGHKWYHACFPDYPKERKAVIPFVL